MPTSIQPPPPALAHTPIAGLHHVTAVAKDAQSNIDFYIKVLGLRLVKLTVNFDDPGTYHTYFGNETGEPGTVITFFPWPHVKRGVQGSGSVIATAFHIPRPAHPFWLERLRTSPIVANVRQSTRFGQDVITFEDHDGMRLELVATDQGAAPWAGPALHAAGIPREHALRGFHSVTLALTNARKTLDLLTNTMGFAIGDTAMEPAQLDPRRQATRTRLHAQGAARFGTIVDLLEDPSLPETKLGAGVVHHVAFRVPDNAAQTAWQQTLAPLGLRATPIQDRSYFQSIYVREPGHVLFEFATEAPGFAADEPLSELGGSLKLPPQYEHARQRIESVTPRVTLPNAKAVGSL